MSLGASVDTSTTAAAATQGQRAGCIADLYAVLGHEHIQSALAIVDSGIACLVSNERTLLFRTGSKLDDDSCYCLLPGKLCATCTQPATEGAADFCVHTTAVLLAVAQSRYSIETLPPRVLADILFSVSMRRRQRSPATSSS
ncbi:hypothetical protein EV175_004515 [Coemansia sp. RSA 1933]|nr:hypothetical protein EV175_004515 [Coemansia sp. RSA 1933]